MDWRQVIRSNRRRSYGVVGVFLSFYLFLGLALDAAVFVLSLPSNSPLLSSGPWPVVKVLAYSWVSGFAFPYITVILCLLAAVWVFVSVAFSRQIVLMGTRYSEVAPSTQDPALRRLYNVTEEMAVAAGVVVPRVYVLDVPHVNAFASGLTPETSLIAVTRPLLNVLSRDELQAVVAHELTHIRNEDCRLMLLVGALSCMMSLILDWVYFSALNLVFSNEREDDVERGGNGRHLPNYLGAVVFLVASVLRFAVPVTMFLLSLFLSRAREYMADAGAVELMRDNGPLGRALIKIHRHAVGPPAPSAPQGVPARCEEVREQAYIWSVLGEGSLFSTHPTLEQRLKSIGFRII